MQFLPGHPRRWPFAVLLILLVVGTWPCYRWWLDCRAERFKGECKDAAQAKQWDRLEELASRWLKWDRQNGYAWLYLGEAAQRQGDFERTAECLNRLDDSDPKCVAALAERVDLLFAKLNRPLEAVETCKRMLRIEPRAGRAHQRLIFFYAMSVQRQAMVKQIRTAMDLQCEPPEAYVYLFTSNALNFSDGLFRVTTWLQQYPDDETLQVAQAYYAARSSSSRRIAMFGLKSFAPGDKSLIGRCLQKYPENTEVLSFHITKAMVDGDLARVAELLKQSPPSAEQDSRFWRYKGWYHSTHNELDQAEAAYRKALKMDPSDWRARLDLSSVLRRLGRTKEASSLADVALRGKKLERKLLELPNAASIDQRLLISLYAYARDIGDKQVVAAFEYRGVPDGRKP